MDSARSHGDGLRRAHALAVLDAGLEAIAPGPVVQSALSDVLAGLDERPRRIVVVGAGKASAGMLDGALGAIDRVFRGGGVPSVEGVLAGPPGVSRRDSPVRLVAGGHPLPTDEGAVAASEMLDLARSAGARDLVIALLSGGASALMSLPAEGLTLQDLRDTSDALLASGAHIREVNTVRKHISAVAGGRLGAATVPARTVALVVSDVVGDDLSAIGSGPTYGDATTFGDALRIVDERGIRSRLPESVVRHLERGSTTEVPETPRPGDDALNHIEHHIVARNLDACRAMAAKCRDLGYRALIISHTLEGEARELGVVHAGLAVSVLTDGVPLTPPCALVTGGEATVTLRGDGIGGRNQESALAAVARLAGLSATFLSAGTDGIDGVTEAAGGIVDGGSLDAARSAGVDIGEALGRNDAGTALSRMECQIVTGSTGTNVADVRLLLVGEGRD